jgi:acetolactate synthase-1/2/3 large subunit
MNATAHTASRALVDGLVALGVQLVFGVSGGGVAGVWSELGVHPDLRLIHTQHESGAAFAATEASLASGQPVAVVVTTGPGLTNALTGLVAARQEGAAVILLSGHTPAARRGRGATQETDHASPAPDLLRPGPVFHVARVLESAEQLDAALRELALALGRPGGCVAHLAVPTDVAVQPARRRSPCAPTTRAPRGVDVASLQPVVDALKAGRARVLVGRGARGADLRALADRSGAWFFSTPDAKGLLPEDHGRCAGVIGVGGQPEAFAALDAPFDLLLALGARLGEAETGWTAALRPRQRVVLVDDGPDLPVGTYTDAPLTLVDAPPAAVVDALLRHLGPPMPSRSRPRPAPPPAPRPGVVHPAALMRQIQAEVVDTTDATVLAESGASFVWAIHLLRMPGPRLRVSVGWGAMGHATTGAVGVAATGRRAVAIVGDGAVLMGNELATAARHRLPVVWVVLNDGGYGLCRHGMRALGLHAADLDQPPVDFAAIASAAGVRGLRAASEAELTTALRAALATPGPALIDVQIDPDAPPPMGQRVQALTFHARELP